MHLDSLRSAYWCCSSSCGEGGRGGSKPLCPSYGTRFTCVSLRDERMNTCTLSIIDLSIHSESDVPSRGHMYAYAYICCLPSAAPAAGFGRQLAGFALLMHATEHAVAYRALSVLRTISRLQRVLSPVPAWHRSCRPFCILFASLTYSIVRWVVWQRRTSILSSAAGHQHHEPPGAAVPLQWCLPRGSRLPRAAQPTASCPADSTGFACATLVDNATADRGC